MADLDVKLIAFSEAVREFVKTEFKNERPRLTVRDKKIDLYSKSCRLYLRYCPVMTPWHGEALVIAAFEFRPSRAGSGKRFLDFLADHAEEFEYTSIGLENTAPGPGREFAKRFGFDSVSEQIAEPPGNHWILRVLTRC